MSPLEVRMTDASTDEENEKFISWEPLESKEDLTTIQINFEEADSFAPMAKTLDLTVTFWGVDKFKSEDELSVRYGTRLHWQIYRQISPAEKEIVDDYSLFTPFKIALILTLLPIIFLGLSLPTWMFLNSLILVAYLPLLNTGMPANLHIFLVNLLNTVRLKVLGSSLT